ncbi:MAG: cellulase family glycosylhydrolase [Dysgonamonadaceae bacterium]|jgi:aryl-phospho-beta-D-glucosidase BglC (GH1 family)|nr:cellulase family glycosylhydrolase [Dysgonamonadaceae bacterium]
MKTFLVSLAVLIGATMTVSSQSFLHTENHDIVDEQGNKILLQGVGLGNWLLPEGYMWKFGSQGDRPRKIEAIVKAHLGEKEAEKFWKQFRKNYITEDDIKRIAELGYNSVRPALNARLFMSEEPPYKFLDEGFQLLDNLIKWCKKYKLYVIIDMHGAPGGQTGQNIDDSPNNLPELFSNPKNQDLLEKLWVKIAKRYRNEPIVAAYDLLNEPLPENTGAAAQYKDQLMPLYIKLIKAIRKVDKKHIFTLEGYNWSNNWSLFDQSPDKNLFFQFHYYCWDQPTNLNDISHFIEKRQKLNTPIWVGETGEKDNTIYFATTQYFEKNNIGWSFWPWKKMDTSNTPYSIKKPEGWASVAAYSQKGEGEIALDAQRIFDELLENVKLGNCVYYPDVVNAMFRRLPLKIEAENYGHDGYNKSYFVKDINSLSKQYRKKEPVKIAPVSANGRGGGQAIVLSSGEWTVYKVNAADATSWHTIIRTKGSGSINFYINGHALNIDIEGDDWIETALPSYPYQDGENELKIEVLKGEIAIDWILAANPRV